MVRQSETENKALKREIEALKREIEALKLRIRELEPQTIVQDDHGAELQAREELIARMGSRMADIDRALIRERENSQTFQQRSSALMVALEQSQRQEAELWRANIALTRTNAELLERLAAKKKWFNCFGTQ